MNGTEHTATGSALRAGRVLPIVGQDPGPLARLEEVKADRSAMLVIANRVAEGESLKSIARAWRVPHGALLLWIMEDDGRMTTYRNACVAAGFTEADEAKEIADDATPDDVAVAKLRADVRRWGAAKKAPEFFGERLDVQMHRALPSEESLLAQLNAMVSAQPWLLDELLRLRGGTGPVATLTHEAAQEGADAAA